MIALTSRLPRGLAALAITGVLTGAASAQDRQPLKTSSYAQRADSSMAQGDVDKDMKLSRQEAGAVEPDLVDRWAEFDVNADGSIDTTEFYLYEAHRHIEKSEVAIMMKDSEAGPAWGTATTSATATADATTGSKPASTMPAKEKVAAVSTAATTEPVVTEMPKTAATKAATAPSGPVAARRASDLVGTDVVNDAHETIGKIDDLTLMSEGRVQHAVVSVGGFLGIGEKLVAVPYTDLAIEHMKGGDDVRYDTTKAALEAMPEYKYDARSLSISSVRSVASRSGAADHPRPARRVARSLRSDTRETRHMNKDTFEGNWKQLKGKVKWGEITDDELDVIDGNREKLEGVIQERYGKTRDEAKAAVDRAHKDWS